MRARERRSQRLEQRPQRLGDDDVGRGDRRRAARPGRAVGTASVSHALERRRACVPPCAIVTSACSREHARQLERADAEPGHLLADRVVADEQDPRGGSPLVVRVDAAAQVDRVAQRDRSCVDRRRRAGSARDGRPRGRAPAGEAARERGEVARDARRRRRPRSPRSAPCGPRCGRAAGRSGASGRRGRSRRGGAASAVRCPCVAEPRWMPTASGAATVPQPAARSRSARSKSSL